MNAIAIYIKDLILRLMSSFLILLSYLFSTSLRIFSGESCEVAVPKVIIVSFRFQRSDLTSTVYSLWKSEVSINSLIAEVLVLKTILKASKELTKFERRNSSDYISKLSKGSSMY